MKTIFNVEKAVIGMLHLAALPGSPANALDLTAIRQAALRDGEALVDGGVHGLILENFGDAPFYPARVPPHTVAFMTAVAAEVVKRFPVPLGINVLRNDARGALAIAAAVGAAFIRVNVYTGARVTDQGIVEGEAHRLLRYRKLLGSSVMVFADVAVKHSAPLADYDLADEVKDTVLRGRADAVIVSGSGTGQETRIEDVKVAKVAASGSAVLIGSGASPSSLKSLFACADGVIVGTAFKAGGVTTNPVDPTRVREFMKSANEARST